MVKMKDMGDFSESKMQWTRDELLRSGTHVHGADGVVESLATVRLCAEEPSTLVGGGIGACPLISPSRQHMLVFDGNG